MKAEQAASPSKWPKALFAIACLCAAGSLSTAFWSGCIADLKSGTWGNFDQALRIEALSLPLDLLAILFACISLVLRPGKVTEQRVATLFALGLLSVFVFAILGMQMQIWGNQSCQ